MYSTVYMYMINETALICRRFLSPACMCVCVCVCVCVFASAMFVNAIQQC